MICNNCKKDIPFEANYCPHCGKKIEQDSLTQVKNLFGRAFDFVYDSVDFLRHHHISRSDKKSYYGAFCKGYKRTGYIDKYEYYPLPDVDEIKDILLNTGQIICACRHLGRWGILNSSGTGELKGKVPCNFKDIAIKYSIDKPYQENALAFAVCKNEEKISVLSVNSGVELIPPGIYDDVSLDSVFDHYTDTIETVVYAKRSGIKERININYYHPEEWWIKRL